MFVEWVVLNIRFENLTNGIFTKKVNNHLIFYSIPVFVQSQFIKKIKI